MKGCVTSLWLRERDEWEEGSVKMSVDVTGAGIVWRREELVFSSWRVMQADLPRGSPHMSGFNKISFTFHSGNGNWILECLLVNSLHDSTLLQINKHWVEGFLSLWFPQQSLFLRNLATTSTMSHSCACRPQFVCSWIVLPNPFYLLASVENKLTNIADCVECSDVKYFIYSM